MISRQLLALAALIVASLLDATSALAIEIDQHVWSFDGQVVANRFNLLSVLATNSSSEPFDGQLSLQKSVPAGKVDAPLVQAVYLAPHSSRWVQFHPYCKDEWEEWEIAWGSSLTARAALTKPRHGRPACVLLEEADTLSTGGGALKRFPDNLFPASITATDGLAGAVLAHVPRWEEPRQKCLLEWVRNGGQLHLLHSPRGEYPRFAGILTPLNTTGAKVRVGAGYVLRHPRERKQIDTSYMDQVILKGRDPAEAQEALATLVAAADPALAGRGQANPLDDTAFFFYDWEGDSPLLRALKKMSRATHSWALIHLLSLLYIALVFPGCLAIGRRREGDYRYVFGALLTIVVVFSLLFFVIGRRGYNENTAVHSLAIARVTGDGRYDVTQWSNVFVTEGGDYEFTHAGAGRMYSSCQTEEAVRGTITDGPDARFATDMPPFSSRSFGHRALLPGPAFSARIVDLATAQSTRQESVTRNDLTVITLPPQTERTLVRLALAKGPQFPERYREAYALFHRRIYSLTETPDGFAMKSEVGSLAMFLKLDQQNQFNRFSTPLSDLEGTPDEIFAALFAPLVGRMANVTSQRDAFEFSIPDDRVRLLVYADMPPEFFIDNPRFESQRGCVLYCLDVFPEAAP